MLPFVWFRETNILLFYQCFAIFYLLVPAAAGFEPSNKVSWVDSSTPALQCCAHCLGRENRVKALLSILVAVMPDWLIGRRNTLTCKPFSLSLPLLSLFFSYLTPTHPLSYSLTLFPSLNLSPSPIPLFLLPHSHTHTLSLSLSLRKIQKYEYLLNSFVYFLMIFKTQIRSWFYQTCSAVTN